MRNLRVAVIAALFAGCGIALPALTNGDGGSSDGSTAASGAGDSGQMDGSEPGDSGQPDSGSPDGGKPDSGPQDGGKPDGGPRPDGGMTCMTNSDCAQGDFCAGRTCDSSGVCTPEPTMCGGTYVPVCGCNGVDFDSKCLANAAGVRVASNGACGTDGGSGCTGPMCPPVDGGRPPPPPDGGCASVICPVPDAGNPTPDAGSHSCMSDSDCATSQYCAGNGCSTAGTCAAKPTNCGTACQFPELCGCDGISYCNACLAEAAGTRVDSTNTMCGGAWDGGIACGSTVCEPGQSCCEPTGVCYSPTCLSCCMVIDPSPDAGTSCFSNADCQNVVTPLGGMSQLYCAANGCGVQGQCEPEPTDCGMTGPSGSEVCGCDGNTYSDSCEAAFNGQNVASDGACSSSDGGVSPDCMVDTDCQGGQICCQYSFTCTDARCTDCCVPPPPAIDGGSASCSANSDCGSGSYCNEDMTCAAPGTCETEPQICPQNVAPVCGCDGNTYSNSCEAYSVGVSVATMGGCGGSGGSPGGGP